MEPDAIADHRTVGVPTAVKRQARAVGVEERLGTRKRRWSGRRRGRVRN